MIGAQGQLGAALVRECSTRHETIALDRAALDVTDAAAVFTAMERVAPDLIVNCTGYNAVDAAEDHPADAIAVNAVAVRSLARAAHRSGAAFVHYSSDFVLDGTASAPMAEDEPPNPRSFYAMSKLVGEWLAADVPRFYVLRVESLFGTAGRGPGKGSVAGIVSALVAGDTPTVFEDRTVSPTYIFDAAAATRELVERRAAPGLYHCVNGGHCTWLELATEAARFLDVEPRFNVVRFKDVRLAAERPQYCALSNQKLASIGIAMPSWQDALGRYLAPLKSATR